MADVTGRKVWLENIKRFLFFSGLLNEEALVDINAILDQLNAVECPGNLVLEQKLVLAFFNKGCSFITIEKTNNFLLSKFFQLVEKILVKNEITLDEDTLSTLVGHIIQSVNICSTISVYDHLKLLSQLLFENGVKCEQFHDDLLGTKPLGLLLKFSNRKNADFETQKVTITCISNICLRDSNGSFIHQGYSEVALITILNVLQQPCRKDVVKIEHCKLVSVCLKAIQSILPCIKPFIKHHLGPLLVTIKNYIYHGFPGYVPNFPASSANISPRDSSSDLEPDDLASLKISLMTVKERSFPGQGALKKKKSRQKRSKRTKDDKGDTRYEKFNTRHPHQPAATSDPSTDDKCALTRDSMATDTVSWREEGSGDHMTWTTPATSSESEYSDSESGQTRRLRAECSKVRNLSLVSLQLVIKMCDKKDLFGFWSGFISDGALPWSLFSIIENDTSFKNRIGATSVLMDLLDGSKQFLVAADDSDQTASSRPFTSFSARLGSMLHELHRLTDIIPNESSTSAQIQMIKCLAVLVLNSPYHKLRKGLLTRIIETTKPLLCRDDLMVKQSVLVCLGATLTVTGPLTEIVACMASQGSQSAFTTKEDAPWLIQECFDLLRNCQMSCNTHSKDAITSLVSEVFNLFIVYVRNYFDLVRPFISRLTASAEEALKLYNASVQVNAIKLLQEMGKLMCETMYGQDEKNETKIIVRTFWQNLLQGELVKILQSPDLCINKSKAAACDCISDVGSNVFQDLPIRNRIFLITILLGLSNDEDAYIKSASVRALGVYVLYQCFKDDVQFVSDVADVVMSGLADSSLLVRMRSAWSLANLSDALFINRTIVDSTFKEDFSQTRVLKLINTAVKCGQDNEKVRCNIVRSLGNLTKYLSPSDLGNPQFSKAVDDVSEVLSNCITTGLMKTRWNACYAAGNVFSNDDLMKIKSNVMLRIFDSLLVVVGTCKNFKVRINAVNALAVPSSRGCYGSVGNFVQVWSCLVDTIVATKDISDFSEFKYRDTLREQISTTICHLANLVTNEDMNEVSGVISPHLESLTGYLSNYHRTQLQKTKEQSCDGELMFVKAYRHITAVDQNGATNVLRTLFANVQRNIDKYLQELSEPESSPVCEK